MKCNWQRLRVFILVPALLMTYLIVSAFAFAPAVDAASATSHPGSKGKGTLGSPNYVPCGAGWIYDDITQGSNTLAPVGPPQANYNGTGSNETSTFSATTSGTVSVTASVSVELDAGVIVSGVKATIGASVSTSITATIGNAATITIPPNTTGNGQYGVWEIVTTGHYYYINDRCNIQTDDGYITTYSPLKVGWQTWIS